MNSQTQCSQKALFSEPMEVGASLELLFEMELDGRLPSWNDILGMETWARYQFKRKLADDFLSGLRRTDGDSLTRIICAPSSPSTYCVTLERYLAMQQAKRKLKSDRKKLAAKTASLLAYKSTVPF